MLESKTTIGCNPMASVASIRGSGPRISIEDRASAMTLPEQATQLDESDILLQRLLAQQVQVPWYRSLFQNVRELIHPPKLPPLELTSTPVPVRDIWTPLGGERRRAGGMSLLIHASVVVLAFTIFSNKTVQKLVKDQVTPLF